MKISALAPWFGSKRTMAPTIVEQLGKHSIYWEPFCGSCSVLFTKPRTSYETVNDLHGDLINLALVVQDESMAKDLYGRMSRTLFHEDMLPQAKGVLQGEWRTAYGDDREADVGRAYWYLVFSWMGLNGISGTPLHHAGTFAVRYSGSGGNGATRWASVCESIPDWHQRLIGVQILSRDAFEIMPRIDDAAGTAIYVDPPYITKGAEYVHDFEAGDHRRLAEELRHFKKARIVVSYYEHPLLADLYPGWSRLQCERSKHMCNSGMRNAKGQGGLGGNVANTRAPEVLLINGPILGGKGRGLFDGAT